jgi:hypothetical protein
MSRNLLAELLTLALMFVTALLIGNLLKAQPPNITQSYGLTLERDDFGPVSIVPPGTNTFGTSVSTRSNFVIVFRNGLLQRACTVGQSVNACDFSVSGNVTVAYPPGVIQPSDLVSLFFYR